MTQVLAALLLLALPSALFADCRTLNRVMAPDTILRGGAGDWPAHWADFLSDDAGSPARNAALAGCAPGEGAAETVACIWRFGLGDPEAAATFQAVQAALVRCLGPDVPIERDQRVNHPDFYDAVFLQSRHNRISLSLKNKSAWKASLVTLRVYNTD